MTRLFSRLNLGLTFGVSGAAAWLAAGCSDDFSDCKASRSCPGSRGGAGGEAAGGGALPQAGQGNPANSGSSGAGGKSSASAGRASGNAGEGGERSEAGGATAPEEVAGAGGEPSAGGSGGAWDLAACVRDADCVDDDACNGEERCAMGECIQGHTVECANEDPDHCEVACETRNGDALCIHAGRDRDGDSFQDAACSVTPGNDCNDRDDTIHPGAPEMCDGTDSDCDGRTDQTEDAVTLPGLAAPVVFGSGPTGGRIDTPAIAGRGPSAMPSGQPFAITWIDWKSGASELSTAFMSDTGVLGAISDAKPASGDHFDLDLTLLPGLATSVLSDQSNPDGWSEGTNWLHLQTSQSSAFRTLRKTVVAQSLSFKDAEYRLVWINGSATSNTIQRLRFSDMAEPGETLEVDSARQHLALDNAGSDVIWTERQTPTLDRVMANLGDDMRTEVSIQDISASHPLIAAASPTSRAFAWRYADGHVMFRHHEEGCTVELDDGFPGELVATSHGFVIVSVSADKREMVADLVGPLCRRGPRSVLATLPADSSETFGEPKAAVTGPTVRAVWTHTSGSHTDIETRAFNFEGCE